MVRHERTGNTGVWPDGCAAGEDGYRCAFDIPEPVSISDKSGISQTAPAFGTTACCSPGFSKRLRVFIHLASPAQSYILAAGNEHAWGQHALEAR